MKRRTLLIAGVGLSAGCVGTYPNGSDNADTEEKQNGDCEDGLIIDDICPREVDRDYIDYEYIDLLNTSDCSIQVEGFVVDYGNGNEYELPKLELISGARLAVLSRDGENTTLEMHPPAHIRSAAFDDTNETSVMNGSGEVRILNRQGDTIDERSYDEGNPEGCR
ncbi:hypothetical protein [Halomontanus rarus]|uniref:hypothetical protein n=1 Tax=Halomontanus rarus TaxID=3034020 RepID=UPI001A9995FB